MRRLLARMAVADYEADAGESPWWDPVTATVLWVDIRAHRLLRYHSDAGDMDVFEAPALPSFAAPLKNGEILCAARDGLFAIGPGSGETRLLFRPDCLTPDMRFNDGTVDPCGRLIIGTMSLDKVAMPLNGGLYAIDGDGVVHCLLDSLGIVNGLAFSLDGSALYVADSHPERRLVWRFDYHRERPHLGNGRVILDFRAAGLPGTPDGGATDAAGGYWVAAHGAGKLLRVDQDVRSHDVPCRHVSKLAFFGPGHDQIAITGFGSALVMRNFGIQGAVLPRLSW
jgi:sugar lactone lactonase YvrE